MSPHATDTTCYQHPSRVAGGRCGRCSRPICPECMEPEEEAWRCASCWPPAARRPARRRWRAGQAPMLGTSQLSPVVVALIVANVVVYLATSHDQVSIDNRFGMVPELVAEGQWYRLVTSGFLHLNVVHILFNMVTLAVIGPPVEAALGKARFLGLYALALLGGSVASYLLGPLVVESVGASGAIFGVMGAYYVLARRGGTETRTVTGLIAINLLIGFLEPGIDWRAHLGGLVVGMVAAYGYSAVADRAHGRGVLAAGGFSIAVAAVIALLAQLPAGHVNL